MALLFEPPGLDGYATVAVPVPVPNALYYSIPTAFSGVRPGCRVRVQVGSRPVVGVVLTLESELPGDFSCKEILEVLDLEPAMPRELLQLAEFMAEYYLAPIGEAVRTLLPSDLPPWGNRRVSLTDGGALAPPRDELESLVVTELLAQPRLRLVELQKRIGSPRMAAKIEEMRRQGRVSMEEPGRRGGGFVKAVELRSGDLDELLERCGRAPAGRAVVEYLAALGRPATLGEIRREVGCGSAAVRRLAGLGLLREFTQPERQSLERHRLGADGEAKEIVLRDDQTVATEALEAGLDAGDYQPFLLQGMTGSGKTEVYLRAAEKCLALGRSAIFLVPEIALVPALARQARQRFGRDLAMLHSNLSSAERKQEWERLRRGEARVALGPRSALLAPLADLGLVVVDEEHDSAYKQDAMPRYNGRDLALWRARHHRAVAVLVSATPSMESRFNVAHGKLQSLELVARAGHGSLPEGILVDLRKEKSSGPRKPGEVTYSQVLRQEVESALEAGDQVILLRNRRGYAPVLLCRACGHDFRCQDCGLPQTLHKRPPRLVCHYCGEDARVPRICLECGQAALEPVGAGTERVEEQFRELFPGVTVDVLDADTNRRIGGAAAVLERFRAGASQVLIGTQMVAKGHHFPRVALAAVLQADSYLGFPDFRAVERTYALLTQLAGRAGRGDRPGRVVIQTFHPDHYGIRCALDGDDRRFASEEMRFRRMFHYPPFTRMIHLLGRHPELAKAEAGIRALAEALFAHPLSEGVRIAGPAPAPLERLRGKWRFQILLRGASGRQLRRLVRESLPAAQGLELTVDVDPYDLM